MMKLRVPAPPVWIKKRDSDGREPDSRPTVCQVLHAMHIGGGEMLARSYALENTSEFRPVFALLDSLGRLGTELREMGYVVEVIGRRSGFDPACALRLGQFFRRQHVAVVHAHQYAPLLYSALARFGLRRTPILFTEHGRDYPDYRRWKRVWANRLILSRQDRFVAVGNCVRDALVKYEGLPRQRVEVIYNGCDLSDYSSHRPLRSTVRAELRLEPDAFVVMQVARLNRLKDHATALRAIARLKCEVPHAILVLVGDGEDRPQLERLIAELHLQSQVRLLGSRDDVARLLQAADAFLLTSVSEGIPLTLIEAMATGLPCVTTRAGGMPEVVADGETGLIAETGDAQGIARCLYKLAQSCETRALMGRNGHRKVREKFNAAVMHAAYRNLYREILGRQTVSHGSIASPAR